MALPGRILVVEDDSDLREVYSRALREEGFDVTTAADGASALRTLDREFDAVLLDVGLPDSDGRDVCHAIRAGGFDVPVLFLTARAELHERLSGFHAGGDDYLVKPVALAELIARLRVVLRRTSASTVDPEEVDLTVDPASHALMSRGDRIALSPTEFRLISRLLHEPGVVVRRRELLSAGWPMGAMVSDNVLDQYVTKLRRKLALVQSVRTIEAARGVGYRIV